MKLLLLFVVMISYIGRAACDVVQMGVCEAEVEVLEDFRVGRWGRERGEGGGAKGGRGGCGWVWMGGGFERGGGGRGGEAIMVF